MSGDMLELQAPPEPAPALAPPYLAPPYPGTGGPQGAGAEGPQGAGAEGPQGAGAEGPQGAGAEGPQGAGAEGPYCCSYLLYEYPQPGGRKPPRPLGFSNPPLWPLTERTSFILASLSRSRSLLSRSQELGPSEQRASTPGLDSRVAVVILATVRSSETN